MVRMNGFEAMWGNIGKYQPSILIVSDNKNLNKEEGYFMKNTKPVLLTALLIIFYFCTSSLAADINGLWKETSWPGDNWITITQEGQQTDIILIGFYEGKMETYKGSGKIKSNSIDYNTHWMKNPRNNADNDLHITLSPDGNTMNGRWVSTKGSSGNFTFVRVK